MQSLLFGRSGMDEGTPLYVRERPNVFRAPWKISRARRTTRRSGVGGGSTCTVGGSSLDSTTFQVGRMTRPLHRRRSSGLLVEAASVWLLSPAPTPALSSKMSESSASRN